MNTLLKTYVQPLFLVLTCSIFLGACSGGDEPEGGAEQSDPFSSPNVDSLSDVVGVWRDDLDVTRDLERELDMSLDGVTVIATYYIVIQSNGDAYQFIDLSNLPGAMGLNCYLATDEDVELIHVEDNLFTTTASDSSGFIEMARNGNTLNVREDNIVIDYTRSSLTLNDLRSNECR